jgi:Domain of unknown function (DUF5673)
MIFAFIGIRSLDIVHSLLMLSLLIGALNIWLDCFPGSVQIREKGIFSTFSFISWNTVKLYRWIDWDRGELLVQHKIFGLITKFSLQRVPSHMKDDVSQLLFQNLSSILELEFE